jgi:excisionase family DNA binding protein
LRRALARQAGLTYKAFAARVRVSYAKVAEYQRRGVVHFHAIIRLDWPNGPTSAPPAWATLTVLTAAIDQAVRNVHLDTPAAPSLPARTVAWGREVDTRPVTTSGDLTDSKVAAYVAKYATTAAECTGTLDRRITPADQLDTLPIRYHARRHIAACIRLSKLSGLEYLRLAAWAHMLGFRGHFATKSRTYSITLGSLRGERAAHQRDQAIAAGLMPDLDGDTALVLTDWHFAGREQPPHLPLTGGCGMTRLLLTVPEAADALAISRSKLYVLLASGAVASIRIDGSRRIPLTVLEAYVSGLLAERTAA